MGKLTQAMLKEFLDYSQETGKFTWKARNSNRTLVGSTAGTKHKSGRIYLNFDGVRYQAHRLVWFYVHGEFPKLCIDHINGDNGDNRISNLRLATHAENMQNHKRARIDSTSQLIGAMPRKRQKSPWYAEIRTAGKKVHLGSFATKEEAHLAYLTAKRAMHSFCTI